MKLKITASGKQYNLFGFYDTETNHVLISKNSKYREGITKSLLPHIVRLRNTILQDCGSEDGHLIEDYDFNSPGAAASVLSGSMANGLDFFKLEDGRTLNEYFGNKPERKRATPLLKEIKNKPLLLPEDRKYKRIYSVGKLALKNSGYMCYVDPNHDSFITDSGTKYMEAHHLIPFKYQNKFEYSLQVQANVVCLCPQCHRELHYGKNRVTLLKRLYDDRIEALRECGLNISFDQLLSFYELKKK